MDIVYYISSTILSLTMIMYYTTNFNDRIIGYILLETTFISVYNLCKINKIYKKLLVKHNKANVQHSLKSQEYITTNNELKKEINELNVLLENNAQIGNNVYMSLKHNENSKIHIYALCESLRTGFEPIIINNAIMSVLHNAGKICKKCRNDEFSYNGVKLYHTLYGAKLYKSIDAVAEHQRTNLRDIIISYDDYKLIQTKFPDIIA